MFVGQGVPLNLASYTEAHTLEGSTQVIAQGPVAALEVIKNLGTNGGGFFNANGAHPYENPTPLTNFLAMLLITVLPASLPITFGHMVGRPRAGWALLAVMVVLFLAGLLVCDAAESVVPTRLGDLGVTGGNLEGKETRFGVGGSVLAAVVTSNGATGSYNSMHDSYQPFGVLVPLVNMLLGEVIFGGLGTGLYSMVMLALVGVFMGGLMVGRTPEYLGKTITVAEAKWIALYTLLMPLVVLPLTSWALVADAGRAGLVTNGGPRGFTEILFAYASCMANNGQNMAGLNANSVFYNVTTAIAMIAGRFGLAIAGAGAGWSLRHPGTQTGNDRHPALRYAHLRRARPRHRAPGRGAVLPARPGTGADRGAIPTRVLWRMRTHPRRMEIANQPIRSRCPLPARPSTISADSETGGSSYHAPRAHPSELKRPCDRAHAPGVHARRSRPDGRRGARRACAEIRRRDASSISSC